MSFSPATSSKSLGHNDFRLSPGIGASDASRLIQQSSMHLWKPQGSEEGKTAAKPSSLEEQLFDSRAQFKVMTAQIAMHIDPIWRTKLFKQLDSLLDAEEWPEEDVPPSIGSYRTLIRLLLLLKPAKKPGFGASHDGHMVAAWTAGLNRLTVECCPRDQIRWSIVREIEADETERAAGKSRIERLPEILAPFRPEVWFSNANSSEAS